MLALVGSGEYLTPMEPVDRYLLGLIPGESHVVCLPTAAGLEGAERIGYWSNLGLDHFTSLGASVEALPVIDHASANDPKLVERIHCANFVYLSGGKPDYLYKTLKGSLAWEAIMKVHESGGVLAGCSAGAMIMGERLPGFFGSQPAFNLLPSTLILPHFDEIPENMVKTARLLVARERTLLGIEGNTALVGMDGCYQVIGKGGVLVWNQHKKSRFTHGQTIVWD